jgi:predicted small metal-binding protein
LPEDFSTGGDIEVTQKGQPLERAGFNENRWPLKRLDGSVAAADTQNGEQRWQLEIDSDECLFFKLLEDSDTEEGRLVSAPSRGEYLVIVPEDWPMPESSGIQLSRELNVSVDGHVGYRFIVRDGVFPNLEFGQRGSRRGTIQFRTACFALAGERADAVFSEYQSPVFLRTPPRVRATDAESWTRVQKVVLGVAGKGRNRWKNGFKPNPTNNEVQLSEHLNGRTSGWYFVRLYDVNELLIDSLYFAFARTLLGIKVSGVSVLPAAGGHGKARLEFEHDAGAAVEIFGEHEAQVLTGGTAFTVPARCEQVYWQICWPGEPALKCITRIEKIWWALGSESGHLTDSDWIDKPVTCKRTDFFAASDKVLFVRLPCTNSVDRFLAGFTHDAARPYNAIAEERNVLIPLRDFSASNQVHTVGLAPFSIWVRQNGHEVFAEALHLEIVYECSFCQQQFSTDEGALAHAVEHEKEFIRELTYDELRRLDPELPPAIYQCQHPNCGWYVRADDAANPTSAIIWHITHRHPNPHGPTHITYRSVTDLDEIRQNVERHLPQIFRCRCGEKFENVRPEDFAEHIFRKHRSQLFNLV